MQNLPLIRAVAEARTTLIEVLPVPQEGPGGSRAVRMAVEALDRVRPAWEAHFGAEGPAFPLDRLVYLPTRY